MHSANVFTHPTQLPNPTPEHKRTRNIASSHKHALAHSRTSLSSSRPFVGSNLLPHHSPTKLRRPHALHACNPAHLYARTHPQESFQAAPSAGAVAMRGRIAPAPGHTSGVSAMGLAAAPQLLLISGAQDGVVKVWR